MGEGLAKLTREMREIFEKQPVVPIATSDKEGKPNVVPVAFAKVIDDETILIAGVYLRKTRRNLEENPKMSITVWDERTRESYQFKGSTTIHESGDVYEEAVKWVQSKRPQLKPKAAIQVKVEEIYTTKPGPTAGERIA